MADELVIDYDAWSDHADQWDVEGADVRQRLRTDPETLQTARSQFGRIGSSTLGASYAAALAERHDLGQRLGLTAEGIGAHVRQNLQTYAAEEAGNTRSLSS